MAGAGTVDLMGLQVTQHHRATLSGRAHLGGPLITGGFPRVEAVGFCYHQSHSCGCISLGTLTTVSGLK